MAWESSQTRHQRRHTDGKYAYGKMLRVLCHPGNAQEDAVRYYYIPISSAKVQNTGNTKRWQARGVMRTLVHCWWDCKVVHPFWKTFRHFLTKLNILLPYALAITLLGFYSNEFKSYTPTKTCTRMSTAALFITAKTWKQSGWLSVVNWIINCGTPGLQNIIQH